MMRTKNAGSRRHVAQTTKYAWVAAATLIVALMLGASVVTAQAQAGIDADAARYAALGNHYQDGIRRGIDADGARYAALGNHYQDGVRRGIDADAARYAALGRYYVDSVLVANPELMVARRFSSTAAQVGQASGSPYTDVAMFYVERMRVQAGQSGYLAANPELMIVGRAFDQGTVSCSPGDEVLAANPELISLRQARGC